MKSLGYHEPESPEEIEQYLEFHEPQTGKYQGSIIIVSLEPEGFGFSAFPYEKIMTQRRSFKGSETQVVGGAHFFEYGYEESEDTGEITMVSQLKLDIGRRSAIRATFDTITAQSPVEESKDVQTSVTANGVGVGELCYRAAAKAIFNTINGIELGAEEQSAIDSAIGKAEHDREEYEKSKEEFLEQARLARQRG